MLHLPRIVVTALLFCCLPVTAPSAVLRPVPIAGASVDWPSFNGDLKSDRFANIKLINTSNVGGLHILCSARFAGSLNFQSGPIVIAGVLYATIANRTIALNAATCASLWVNTYATTNVTQMNRGIAYAGGVLYRGFADGHVVAINAANGATIWNQKITASGSFEQLVAAPVVWNGLVFIGSSDGDTAQVCHMFALDGSTGKIVWSRHSVPNPGESWAKTWQGATNIAGGSMWTSLSIDTSSGTLFVPVGNPEPDYDIRGRLGQNLYTNSMVELATANGTLKGGLQLVPQDAHDWDQSAAPVIATLSNGTKIVLTAGKDGYLRSINAATSVQTWKTAVTTIANASAPITTSGTHFCPAGAVLWNGPAYSPANGLAFVNAVDRCTTIELSATPQPYVAGHTWTGSANGFGTPDAAKSGWLSAINATSGAVAWRYHASLPLLAGVTPTAGNLVFTADLRGDVLAFNATSGALLATIPTALPVGGGVLSYEVSSKQYVAVAAGISNGAYGAKSTATSIVVLGI